MVTFAKKTNQNNFYLLLQELKLKRAHKKSPPLQPGPSFLRFQMLLTKF
jgi:hypothetical protein